MKRLRAACGAARGPLERAPAGTMGACLACTWRRETRSLASTSRAAAGRPSSRSREAVRSASRSIRTTRTRCTPVFAEAVSCARPTGHGPGGLRAPGGRRVLARCEPGERSAVRRDRAERALPQRRRRRHVARAHRAARSPLAPDVELPAAAVDVTRPLGRPEPARRGRAPRRDRARRSHALDRRR